MKNASLLLLVIFFSLILIYLDKTYITTDSKIFDFLAKDYPSSVVQNYMDSQKKWWWVSYVTTPVLIGIKVLLVAFCLNFVKIISEKLEDVKFRDILTVVLIAEFVFVIAGFYKFFNFYLIDTDYTLETLQNSAIKIYVADAETGKNISNAKVCLEGFEIPGYMAAFFRQVKIGVLTLTLEKKQ